MKKIILFGDSIFNGFRDGQDTDLVTNLFQKELKDYAQVENISKSGATTVEAIDYLHLIPQKRDLVVVEAVLAIKPDIPADVVEKFLPKIKQVLVMTVNPGFGGQSFIADSAEKIKQVREIVGPNMAIEVDGGINDRTIKIAKDAGADVFVVGSYLYENGNIANQVLKLEKIIK